MTPAQAVVDREVCVGHGRCYDAAPDIFEPDEHGFSIVVGEATGPQALQGLHLARRNCPERAISIRTPQER